MPKTVVDVSDLNISVLTKMPRDCTAQLIRVARMYSPTGYRSPSKPMNGKKSKRLVKKTKSKKSSPGGGVSRTKRGPKLATKRISGIYKQSSREACAQYALALRNPFHPGAKGARVPDMWAAPTVTYQVEGSFSVASDASNAVCLLLTANPLLTVVDMLSTTGGDITPVGMSKYTNSQSVYAAANSAAINGVLASFRVVAAGYRVRNLTAPTSATGKLAIAPVPSMGFAPGPNILTAQAWSNVDISSILSNFKPAATSGATAGFGMQIIALPDGEEVTQQDLIENELRFSSKPLTPAAFDFHSGSTTVLNSASSFDFGADSADHSTQVVKSVDAYSSINFAGWQNLLMQGTGFPSGTVLEVNYIIHLEGTPANASTSNGILVADASDVVVDVAAHNKILGWNSLIDPITLVASKIASGIESVGRIGSKVAQGAGALSTALASLGLVL